jgi:hypothetical protein
MTLQELIKSGISSMEVTVSLPANTIPELQRRLDNHRWDNYLTRLATTWFPILHSPLVTLPTLVSDMFSALATDECSYRVATIQTVSFLLYRSALDKCGGVQR